MIKMKSKALQSLFKSELWHPSEGILNQDGMDSDDDKMMTLMTNIPDNCRRRGRRRQCKFFWPV